ncbi:MAG: hypothetical protein WCU88_12410 [Elusimicrobiota bacterium]|jgi:hypothetical protein
MFMARNYFRAVLLFSFSLIFPAARCLAQGTFSQPNRQSRSVQTYGSALADALIADSLLPTASADDEELHRRALDFRQGRAPDEEDGAFQARLRRFCAALRLDPLQESLVFEHLKGRVRAQAAAGDGVRSVPGALSPKTGPSMLSNGLAHAAALGLPADFEGGAFAAGAPLPAEGKRALRIAQRKPVAAPVFAAAESDAPISWSELEKTIKFGHRPLPIVGDRLLNFWRRWVPRSEEAVRAEALSRKALDLILTAPEGRKVLRELIDEYRRAGKTVVVGAAEMPGSRILRNKGVEALAGMYGLACYTAYPPQCWYKDQYVFNDLFLDFKDQGAAAQYLAAVMSHEFQHLAARAYVHRVDPQAEDVFTRFGLINEQRAREVGYLVAVRVHNGRRIAHLTEAESFVQDPDRTWDNLKSDDYYAENLDLQEMKDPVAALQAHQRLVGGSEAEAREFLEQKLPRRTAAADILENKESLGPALEDIRANIQALKDYLPRRIEGLGKGVRTLQSRIDQLSSPRHRALVEDIRKAADSPALRKMASDLDRDQKALIEFVNANPLPSAPAGGQLNMDDFRAKVKESRRLHPQYWAEYWKRFGKSEDEF